MKERGLCGPFFCGQMRVRRRAWRRRPTAVSALYASDLNLGAMIEDESPPDFDLGS